MHAPHEIPPVVLSHPSIEHLVATCHLGDLDSPAQRPVFAAPFPCRLAAGGLVVTNDLPESAQPYLEVSLVQRRAGSERPIVTKTTRARTGETIGAGTYWHFDVCEWDRDAARLATGAVVMVRVRTIGAPPLRLEQVLVMLRYEPT